jgi:hypothetical protein
VKRRVVRETDGLDYVTWIRLANSDADQDRIWRLHELHARYKYASDASEWRDLGGES